MIVSSTSQFDPSLGPDEVIAGIAALVRNGGVHDFGTFSAAIYDTAWVSMVHKIVDKNIVWLFEDCFNYLLDQQRSDDGVWQTSTTPIDGILNTAAGLLALLVRQRHTQYQQSDTDHLQPRIDRAQRGLRTLLGQWSVEATDAVGFEILVPSLLRQIADFGIHFEYAGSEQLEKLYQRKLKKFRPEFVYSKKLLTLHHSLEGLVGMIDFDKVRHHCTPTLGMLGSPASTAAYLINSSVWDDGAESYLRRTLEACGGVAVPSAFPTYLFEVSWTLSILLDPSVNAKPIADEDAEVLSSFFTRILDNQKGVVGFAAGALEDADDTARVLLTLNRLGRPYDHEPLISNFESESCFRTYQIESNPSFSANCNVLLTLLEHDLTATTIKQVEKTLTFLLDQWDCGKAEDKWNESPYYVFMLFTDVLLHLLKRYNDGDLDSISDQLMSQRVPSAICQLLSEVILKQSENGSWNSSPQVTSYAVITLAQCLVLPWSSEMKTTLTTALDRGRNFMTAVDQLKSDKEFLWIEKVTYNSSLLQSVYHITALHIRPISPTWNEAITATFVIPKRHSQKIKALFSRLPLLTEKPTFCVEIALVEAMSLSKRLTSSRLMIFPRDQMPVTTDKYLEFIPILWAAANQIGGNVLPPALVWEMALQSMFIYQIDEYMESVVAGLSQAELLSLDLYLQKSCNATSSTTCQSLADKLQIASIDDEDLRLTPPASPSHLTTVKATLIKYVDYVCSHPAVMNLSDNARNGLTLEIYNFMHAHMMQNVLNRQLKAQRSSSSSQSENQKQNLPPLKTQIDYEAWVRTLGANTTSGPMAFHLFTTLIDHYSAKLQKSHTSQDPAVKYCLETLSRHLAIMCRQYNDIGSVHRDREEGNLNSLDFTLFHPTSDDSTKGSSASLDEAKDQLMRMADIERSCVELMLNTLKRLSPSKGKNDTFTQKIQVFVDVTDLFGQIYIVKDFSSRVQQQPQ